MLIFAVFWVICGGVAAFVADSRGANPGLGFLAGVLLGPLGIVIAMFMGSDADRARKQVASGSKKACPRCAETVQRAALVCKHCGHEFPAEQRKELALPPDTTAAVTAVSAQPPATSDGDRWLIGGVIVVISILFIVAGIVASAGTQSPPAPVEASADMLAENLQAAADALDAAAANTAAH